MAKQPKWTKQELETLKDSLDQHIPFKEISEKLKRSIIGIKLISNRVLKYNPLCLDCGQRIFNRKGNRLRCKFCSLKRVEKQKKDYMKTEKMKTYLREKRDRDRFSGLREKIIKRDGGKCVDCGMSREEHILKFGCDITINHKDGKGRNSKKKNNSKDNLETLCLVCHGKKDVVRRRKDWSMCAEFLKRYWKKNPKLKIIKHHCSSCGKYIKNNKKRHVIYGNFCEKCSLDSNFSKEQLSTTRKNIRKALK